MTLIEARELSKEIGTDNIKDCINLFNDIEGDHDYTIDFGVSHPSGDYYYRWRYNDMSGTTYGKRHSISKTEATILYALRLSPWSFEEISKDEEYLNYVFKNFEQALKDAVNIEPLL
jgi:hypothetical protein